MMSTEPVVHVLGRDPSHRRHILNGCAYQQSAITGFRGWQYVAWYTSKSPEEIEPLHLCLSRRNLQGVQTWETIVFDDYPQITDDGHNTVQLGICGQDGTIHLSYDHHCDILRYRHSKPGVASSPGAVVWNKSIFTTTLDHLPGLSPGDKKFGYVTYPRFIPAGDNLLFTLRTGKAGLGDDHLYLYQPEGGSGKYKYLGRNIQGVLNNPYVHGLDYKNGTLHATWVWRGFVEYPGWDDPLDTKHKTQAGPNGAENNYDICYAYSEDDGLSWKNGKGEVVADLGKGESIEPSSKGITAFEIPKGSGLTNQESQAVDDKGRVFVMNRDTLDGGPTWNLYWRSTDGTWTRQPICSVPGGRRGRLAAPRAGKLLILLPDEGKHTLRLLQSDQTSNFSRFEELWLGNDYWGEPLVDHQRLETEDVLSVFTLQGTRQERNVVVLDFSLA